MEEVGGWDTREVNEFVLIFSDVVVWLAVLVDLEISTNDNHVMNHTVICDYTTTQ